MLGSPFKLNSQKLKIMFYLAPSNSWILPMAHKFQDLLKPKPPKDNQISQCMFSLPYKYYKPYLFKIGLNFWYVEMLKY